MNLFSNPIVICGLIAFGIILILTIVVIVCCKKSSEREELKMLSEEIDADLEADDNVYENSSDKIEDVLMKMQDALEVKEEQSSSFEQEQEENAVISYQELLDSLGNKGSINLDDIDLYEDELENQLEISDFNKEIIDAYQKEDLDKEIYRFQNDFSNQPLEMEINNEENPFMNLELSSENVEFVDEKKDNEVVYTYKNDTINNHKKFRRTEIISPVYGIIKNDNVNKNNDVEEVEEIIFEDSENSLLDEF